MLRFARRNISPPGGRYFYEVPETGVYFEHPQFDKLELLVREHYYSNDMKLPDSLPAMIEDYMCSKLPESFCQGVSSGQFKRAKVLTFWIVTDKTNKLLAADLPFVDLKEADRRAAICVKCPNNFAGICASCSGLKHRFGALIRGRSTAYDKHLGVCTVDGSLSTVKIHMQQNAVRQLMDKETKADMEGVVKYEPCWVYA